jgi:hypothetical protein
MRSCLPKYALILSCAATAADAQDSRAAPPRHLDGAWELVRVNGQPLPLAAAPDGGDPSECDGFGEYVGTRLGEGRLVIRTAEMWKGPWSDRWEGGVYAYVPEEVLCRGRTGVVALRRGADRRAQRAADVAPEWRTGSYGSVDSVATLVVADQDWTLRPGAVPASGMLHLEDVAGNRLTFRRALTHARFETPGFVVLLGDYDGDGRGDQVSAAPGPFETRTVTARLAAGQVARVGEIPAEAQVQLAPRAASWRNADGGTLELNGRDAILVSTEPAPGRSDVVLYHLRNGGWVRWEYAPD